MAKSASRLARAVKRGSASEALAAIAAWPGELLTDGLLLATTRRGKEAVVEALFDSASEIERSRCLIEAIRGGRALCVRALMKRGVKEPLYESSMGAALQWRQWECLREALPICSDWWLENGLHMGAASDDACFEAILGEMGRRGLREHMERAARRLAREGSARKGERASAWALSMKEQTELGLALGEMKGRSERAQRGGI